MKFHLSQQQEQVVKHGSGALLVIAGPGSGKTRVLTERIRRILTDSTDKTRVLALTFTNKAANEMEERLSDLGELRNKAFIGTLHSFCLELLTERGKPIGISGPPQIFEQYSDRKEVLISAAASDPYIKGLLEDAGDQRSTTRLIDSWLREISAIKAHPISRSENDDPRFLPIYEAYNAGLRASGAYDFDDLLLLSYQLLNENPKIADLYRRIYGYICIDEAQDLNEAQYCVLQALCGDTFNNVLMVGDPKQSIYGFNTSSSKYMAQFEKDFCAKRIELTQNFRSSKCVVRAAQSLIHNYMVEAQLPINGDLKAYYFDSEELEAKFVSQEITNLIEDGHPDIEGKLSYERIAVLGRTRFTLLKVEKELLKSNIPYYKGSSGSRDFESSLSELLMLSLRVYANPKDRLHIRALGAKWGISDFPHFSTGIEFSNFLCSLGKGDKNDTRTAISNFLQTLDENNNRIDLRKALDIIANYADTKPEEDRIEIYEDLEVLRSEWDGYLRNSSGKRSIQSFLSSMALGSTQKFDDDGIGLLTVHSSKGLEFDVVFIVGMAEGVFPDYRARTNKDIEEEKRNAFVAITRSKRLLYLTYSQFRVMPWGDTRPQRASRFLMDVYNNRAV